VSIGLLGLMIAVSALVSVSLHAVPLQDENPHAYGSAHNPAGIIRPWEELVLEGTIFYNNPDISFTFINGFTYFDFIGNGEPSLTVFAMGVNLREYQNFAFRDFGVFAEIDGQLHYVWFWLHETWLTAVVPHFIDVSGEWDFIPALLIVLDSPARSIWTVTFEDGSLKASPMRRGEIEMPSWYPNLLEYRERK